jgi:hypothetical protein
MEAARGIKKNTTATTTNTHSPRREQQKKCSPSKIASSKMPVLLHYFTINHRRYNAGMWRETVLLFPNHHHHHHRRRRRPSCRYFSFLMGNSQQVDCFRNLVKNEGNVVDGRSKVSEECGCWWGQSVVKLAMSRGESALCAKADSENRLIEEIGSRKWNNRPERFRWLS